MAWLSALLVWNHGTVIANVGDDVSCNRIIFIHRHDGLIWGNGAMLRLGVTLLMSWLVWIISVAARLWAHLMRN